MKRLVAYLGVFGLVMLSGITGLSLFTSAATRCDFNYRLAEVDCVRRAVDPFRVWNEEAVVKPYFSNNPQRKKAIPDGCTEPISVYVPWEYTLMLPFSLIDKEAAWWIYSVLSMLAMGWCVIIVAKQERQSGGGVVDSAICATIPFLCVAHSLWSNAQVGNHMAIVLLTTILMARFFNRGQDIAAGVCWAIMMVKPQIGLIFAVPILMRMKLRASLVAVGICLILALYPALQCHTSLFDLLREPSLASAFAFEGCGTMPRAFCGVAVDGGDILVGLIIGALVCGIMTLCLKGERDWFVLLMPAAVTSCCWTYTQAYSHAMGCFLAFVIVRELLKSPKSAFLWILAGFSALSLTRWLLAWRGFSSFFGLTFPMSEYAFRCVDSLNSTLTLAIAFAFCVRSVIVRAESGRIARDRR